MANPRSRVGGYQQLKYRKNGMVDKRTTPESVSLAAVYCTSYEEELIYLLTKTPNGFHYLPSPAEIEDLKQVIREENQEREGINCVDHARKVCTDNFARKTYKLDIQGQGGRHGKII